MGPHRYDGFTFRLSETPGKLRMPAPCLGEHNEYIYSEILGLGDDEIGDLLVDGVITTEADLPWFQEGGHKPIPRLPPFPFLTFL